MIDPATLTGSTVYVKGTNCQYTVIEVNYDKLSEDMCYVVLDTCGSPPKEVLDRCTKFNHKQLRDYNGSYGSQTYECTFRLSDISDVPFGSPLAQVIYGGSKNG